MMMSNDGCRAPQRPDLARKFIALQKIGGLTAAAS